MKTLKTAAMVILMVFFLFSLACRTAPLKETGQDGAVSVPKDDDAPAAAQDSEAMPIYDPGADKIQPETSETVRAAQDPGQTQSLSGTAVQNYPPLKKERAAEIISGYSKKGFYLLREKGKPLILSHDLTGTGFPDYFVFFIQADNPAYMDAEYLSALGRIYRREVVPAPIFLACFSQNEDTLKQSFSLNLGELMALGAITPFPVKESRAGPFCIDITFLSVEGGERLFVSINEKYETSQLLFHDYSRHFFIREDIGEDGTMDLLVASQGFEEGTGYETFLTWYRWEKKGFYEFQTVNIVRNLNAFLSRTVLLLRRGDWAGLISLGHPPAVSRTAGMTQDALFQSALKPFKPVLKTTETPAEPPFSHNKPPRDVFFPLFMENPFNLLAGLPASVPLTVRFESRNSESFFFNVRVMLQKNPFSQQQYFFLTE